MKDKTKKLIFLLMITLMSFTLACQDRLIVLWDEVPTLFQDMMDIANIVDNSTVTSTQTTFQNDGAIQGMADILMVIDNSGSMGEEVAAVKQYVNTLSSQMDSSGIDYRFILISANSTSSPLYGVTVPPPLGTSNRFKHLNINVTSWSALADICNHHGKYKSFLRKGATLNFIVITDDDSKNMTYSTFKNNMKNFDKAKFTMHGIIGLYDDINVYSIGHEYITGIDETGGVKLDITTDASKWGSLFKKITDNIIDQMPETDYTLSNLPNIVNPGYPEGSMTVTINGSTVHPYGNWQYNSTTNTIEFTNPNLLNTGGTIEVDYTVLDYVPIQTTYPLSDVPYLKYPGWPELSIKVEINEQEVNYSNNWIYSESSNAIVFTNKDLLHDGDIVNIYYQIKK